jgi:hypothetical protein
VGDRFVLSAREIEHGDFICFSREVVVNNSAFPPGSAPWKLMGPLATYTSGLVSTDTSPPAAVILSNP